MSTTHATARIAKTDDARQRVYGWASVVAKADGQLIVDAQGDMIDPAELEEAMVDFMLESRDMNEMHAGTSKGVVFEAFMGTPEKYEAMGIPAAVAQTLPVGAWIGVQTDPDTYAKVKAGTYQMFSIEGTATREPV